MTERRMLRGLVGAGVVVTFCFGWQVLHVLNEQEDAWSAYAAAEREMADLESMIGARLEEATGQAGVDGRFPTEDEGFEAQLQRLVDRAPDRADAALLAEAIRLSDDEVRADAEADGAADERLLADLDGDLRALDRTVVRPLGDTARDTPSGLQIVAILVFFLVSTALWVTSAWVLFNQRVDKGADPA